MILRMILPESLQYLMCATLLFDTFGVNGQGSRIGCLLSGSHSAAGSVALILAKSDMHSPWVAARLPVRLCCSDGIPTINM